MASAFKKLFGQGKSKGPVALCIGDFSHVSQPLNAELTNLESILQKDEPATTVEGASTSSPPQSHNSQGGHRPTLASARTSSFKALRHLLQNLGAGKEHLHPGSEAEGQRRWSTFLKMHGFTDITFAGNEEGVLPRDKVVGKLTKLFKAATSPVVLVAYCGPSDERGNWRLAPPTGAAAGTSSAGSVLSFRELSMLWQRHRKHSQRLVLLLDCPNSGFWEAALRLLSKAEQLELSLGVQASESCSPMFQALQLSYKPGIFLQCYMTSNKHRPDSRRNNNSATSSVAHSTAHTPRPEADTTPTTPGFAHQALNTQPLQHLALDLQAAAAPDSAADSQVPTAGGGSGGATASPTLPTWLPGMMPSCYTTWLTDSLFDYGIPLRFHTLPVPAGHEDMAAGLEGPDTARVDSHLMLQMLQAAKVERRPSEVTGHTSAGSQAGSPKASDAVARRRYSAYSPVIGTHHARPVMASEAGWPMAGQSMPQSALYDSSASTHAGPATGHGTAQSSELPHADRPISTPVLAQQRPASSSYSPSYNTGPWSATGPMKPQVFPAATSAASAAAGLVDSGARSRSSEAAGAAAGHDNGGSSCGGVQPAGPDVVLDDPRLRAVIDARQSAVSSESNATTEQCAVEHSAASDSYAMDWARRKSRRAEDEAVAELLEQHPQASSFTNATGFTSQLYGALQDVVQMQKLRGRRAPLEGDETMDGMLEDEDTEARMSIASLPSFIMPHAGALGPALPHPITTRPSGAGAAPGEVPPVTRNATPHATPASMTPHQMTNPSRLGHTSSRSLVAGSGSRGQVALGGSPSNSVLGSMLARDQMRGSQSGRDLGSRDNSTGSAVDEYADADGAGCAGGVSAGQVASPFERASGLFSNEVLALSQVLGASPGSQSPRRISRAGSARQGLSPRNSSHLFKTLLRNQVSIADSEDWDASPAPPRRPGRMEVAGSETSSFLWNDDSERFEMLRMLRDHPDHPDNRPGAGHGQGDEEEGEDEELYRRPSTASDCSVRAEAPHPQQHGGDAVDVSVVLLQL